MLLNRVLATCVMSLALFPSQLTAQDDNPQASYILIQNVKVFDGVEFLAVFAPLQQVPDKADVVSDLPFEVVTAG